MSEAREKILAMISTIRRCWIGREMLLAGTTLGILLIVWLTAAIVADNVMMLSSRQLAAAWGALLVLCAAGAAWVGHRVIVARPDSRELALQFERRIPAQANRLINAVDFIKDQRIDHDPMARAAVVENAAHLDASSAPGAIDWRIAGSASIALGACLLVLLAYLAVRPSLAANAIARLASPMHPPPHAMQTSIRVLPGDAKLVEGDSLLIQAIMSQHVPDTADVECRSGSTPWTRAAMQRGEGDAFSYDGLRGLWQSLEYRVVAGRSISPTYHVSVQLRPKVEHVQVFITPPVYTGASQRTQPMDQGDVSALPGSTIRVKATASANLSAAWLELGDGTKTPLALTSADAKSATGTFVLQSGGSYAIHVADTSQPNALTNLTPPRYALSVQDDQPPAAMFTTPGRDLILPADATIDLKLAAEDDWGLASVSIEIKVGNDEWTTIARADMPVPGEKHRQLEATIALAEHKLGSGQVLLYRASASDHRQPKANVFVGRPWSIAIGSATSDAPLLAAEAKRFLDSLQAILALQKEARSDVDMDRDVPTIREKQARVRELTLSAIDQQRKALRPMVSTVDDLTALADGPMVRANSLLQVFGGTYQQRQPHKKPILDLMDQIIARLEELIGRVGQSVAQAEQARQAMQSLSPDQKQEALREIRDILQKLRQFIPEQDKVIEQTEELVRKAGNYTKEDLQTIEKLAGTEDEWAEVFAGKVDEINKLLEQGFADASIANDFKEMVEQIEQAALDLNPPIKQIVVSREQTALELATEIKQDMEMWLPSTPDDTQWIMEEPLTMPDVPMPPLPENLVDMIGDLIAEESELNEAAEDQTSSWADSISAAGWMASDGPISNFSAKGITGNQLPNNQEVSGRAGDGRSGKSQGQMVENVAKGLEGRKTPTRVTNDSYEQGVVKELQQMKTGGATGGGKARGSGQEGLQGTTPPPDFDRMPFMKDWQQRIRQKAERLAGQLKSVRLHIQELDRSIEAMKQAETAAAEGRYADMFKAQQMVLQQLRAAEDLAARDASVQLDRAGSVPADRRKPVLDAAEEPVPPEYHSAVKRYFEQLSQEK